MARMKKAVLLLGISLFLGTVMVRWNSSFAFPGEPTGFQCIPWGTRLGEISKTIQNRMGLKGSIEIITFEGETFQLGTSGNATPQYMFHMGRLVGVTVTWQDLENWSATKDYFFETYGAGTLAGPKYESYRWQGDTTTMGLAYDPESGTCVLAMYATQLIKGAIQPEAKP